jgi:CRP-like cAMP-binding protein
MTALEKATNHISLLSPGIMEVFLSKWQYWTVPKDYLLLREQQVSDYIYFINKGVARIFYYKNGKEISEWFATDEQFFLSITSFFNRTPSRLQIHTLEPSEIMGIHHNDLMELAANYHEVETLFRKMMTASLILSQYRMDSIQFETAQQRYEGLVKNSPEIIKRVPLSYIASFLGVTLETLSRIRAGK